MAHMNRRMIGNWEVAHLSVPQRFMAYAEAYLESAIAICNYMEMDEAHRVWPNACVAMLLSAHAIELFLKGAILARVPEQQLTHHLNELKERFDELYPSDKFAWELPFQTEYLGMNEEEIAALEKSHPLPSIQYRYPVDREGNEWDGIHGFTPDGFRGVLFAVQEVFRRIKEQMGDI